LAEERDDGLKTYSYRRYCQCANLAQRVPEFRPSLTYSLSLAQALYERSSAVVLISITILRRHRPFVRRFDAANSSSQALKTAGTMPELIVMPSDTPDMIAALMPFQRLANDCSKVKKP